MSSRPYEIAVGGCERGQDWDREREPGGRDAMRAVAERGPLRIEG